jgi:hypothetical protein
MLLTGKASSPSQREGIANLLRESLRVDAESEKLQSWKYWDPHPFYQKSRSHILLDGDTVVAHGCAWPVRLKGAFGELPAMHLIDWAARRNAPGAGMLVLRLCQADVGAVFSIGGSDMTRKILPAFGFKPYNSIFFLNRPLRPISRALLNTGKPWKLPARFMRNILRHTLPKIKMPPDWTVSQIEPQDIPDSLFSRPLAREAISQRSPEFLEYMMSCPVFEEARCYIVRHENAARAYFCLVNVRSQARLVDYGPNGLDEQTGSVIAMAAQDIARSERMKTSEIFAATTEPLIREGFLRAGLRTAGEEKIKVLKLNNALKEVNQFRLTLLDWDAAIL